MGLNRHNPKRDATERAVIETVKAFGCWPNQVSAAGFPDLVCLAPPHWQHRMFALEVKASEKARLTASQRVWHETAQAFQPAVAIVWDVDSTVDALNMFRDGPEMFYDHPLSRDEDFR